MPDSAPRDRAGDAIPRVRAELHDLTNALARVVGNVELLARDADLPDRLRALADDALDGADRAAKILAEIQATVRAVDEARHR